jgi:hypothetical protein
MGRSLFVLFCCFFLRVWKRGVVVHVAIVLRSPFSVIVQSGNWALLLMGMVITSVPSSLKQFFSSFVWSYFFWFENNSFGVKKKKG